MLLQKVYMMYVKRTSQPFTAYNLQEMLENIQKRTRNRLINPLDMIQLSEMTDVLAVLDEDML